MAKSTREILVDARALVARGHCKNTGSRDASGRSVPARSDEACSWCSLASLSVVANGEPYQTARDALAIAIGGTRETLVALWNDAPERTQADVLAAFDRAIAACGGEA